MSSSSLASVLFSSSFLWFRSSSSAFWHFEHSSSSFALSVSRLRKLEGRTEWLESSTHIRGNVAISASSGLNDPLDSPSPEASTLLSHISFCLRYLSSG